MEIFSLQFTNIMASAARKWSEQWSLVKQGAVLNQHHSNDLHGQARDIMSVRSTGVSPAGTVVCVPVEDDAELAFIPRTYSNDDDASDDDLADDTSYDTSTVICERAALSAEMAAGLAFVPRSYGDELDGSESGSPHMRPPDTGLDDGGHDYSSNLDPQIGLFACGRDFSPSPESYSGGEGEGAESISDAEYHDMQQSLLSYAADHVVQSASTQHANDATIQSISDAFDLLDPSQVNLRYGTRFSTDEYGRHLWR